MAHINFLEPSKFSLRQFNLKNFEMNYFWMMVIGGILVVLMVLYGVAQRHRIGSLNAELIVATAEAKKKSGVATKPGAPQKASLMDALQQRVQWSPILNAIANHTPDTVSLNYIKGIATGARTLQIEGMGADVLSAARYEDALTKIPYFSKVLLQSSSAKVATGGKVEAEKSDASKTDKASVTPGVTSGKSQLVFEIQGWLK